MCLPWITEQTLRRITTRKHGHVLYIVKLSKQLQNVLPKVSKEEAEEPGREHVTSDNVQVMSEATDSRRPLYAVSLRSSTSIRWPTKALTKRTRVKSSFLARPGFLGPPVVWSGSSMTSTPRSNAGQKLNHFSTSECWLTEKKRKKTRGNFYFFLARETLFVG